MNNRYSPFQPILAESTLRHPGLEIGFATPCNTLTSTVHCYLCLQTTSPTPYPVIPDGTQAMYISRKGVFVGGPKSATIDLLIPKSDEYFGIWFRPGALRHWFDVDLSEVIGPFFDTSECRKHDMTQLIDDLYARDRHSPSVHIQNWLMKNYKERDDSKFDRALELVFRSFGNEQIATIASYVGWSTRTLNRHFLRHTGLSTKQFAQIIRLQRACSNLYAKWSDTSMATPDHGYFDQSHLTKAFKQFLSATPGTFFERFMSDLYN